MRVLGNIVSAFLALLLLLVAVALYDTAPAMALFSCVGAALIFPLTGRWLATIFPVGGRAKQVAIGIALAIFAGPIVGAIVGGFTAPSERTEVAAAEPKPDEIMEQLAAPPEPPRPMVAKAPNREREQRQKAAWLEVEAKDRVASLLKDPDSAKFRNISVNTDIPVVCGEVNGKNGFGGYGGYQGFFSNGVNITVLSSAMAPGEFEKAWSQMCR